MHSRAGTKNAKKLKRALEISKEIQPWMPGKNESALLNFTQFPIFIGVNVERNHSQWKAFKYKTNGKASNVLCNPYASLSEIDPALETKQNAMRRKRI